MMVASAAPAAVGVGTLLEVSGTVLFWVAVGAAVARAMGSGGQGRAGSRRPGEWSSWAKGASGERDVAAALEATRLVALHDRSRPGMSANIDHLVVGPAGVYVVDAKNYDSGWLRMAGSVLMIGDRDQSGMLGAVARQAAQVRGVLRSAGVNVAVVPVLCFTGSSAPVVVMDVAGVRLTTLETLAAVVGAPGPIEDPREAERVGDVLAWYFPPV